MLRKIRKTLLITAISLVVFVVLVVILVDRDEQTGQLSLSFQGKERKISESEFTRLIEEEINFTELSQVDWANAYNQVLENKYKNENYQKNSSINEINSETVIQETTEDKIFNDFISYLQASESRLDESQNPLLMAIEYRDQGKRNEINKLIEGFDQRISLVENIQPPEEIVGYHLAKLRLMRDMKVILTEIKESEEEESLEEIIGENKAEHLAQLNLILKKYLIYFFYPRLRA